MSDAKTIMQRSVRRVEEDLERIGTIVRTVERELAGIQSASNPLDLIGTMKEQLSEVHMRLEGLYAFVQACERRAFSSAKPEDIDLWL